jgi:hypothetical protein
MDFSMPCWKNANWLILLTALLWSSAVFAEGITVNKAEVRVGEDSYQLAADFKINLSAVVEQALSHGVAIYFVSEFSITRSRWYWLDEQIAKTEQVTKLTYNVLTRQYRISRGALYQNFPSLGEALQMVQRQSASPIAAAMLKKNGTYLAGARLKLDIAQLPKLLQVNALTNKDWELDSDWYRWVIRPEELALRSQQNTEVAH